MHCFAHCRIAADAGVDAAEVHLANKKNCINFIKFEMSSNCRALPAKCIHIQTNIFIYACGCVCVAERVLCVCVWIYISNDIVGWSTAESRRRCHCQPLPLLLAPFCPCYCFCFWLCLCHCRVQFAAILKIVHQNPQSNLLRCFMTVLRAADFTPLKTTAQPTHNTHTHTTHTPIRNTHFTCKSCINFCRHNTNNNKVTHCRVAHWSCG